MIVWGSGGKTVYCSMREQYCDVCKEERTHHIMLGYRYWGVYWIFNFITEKHYLLVCAICDRTTELNSDTVEPTLDKHPIPFIHQWGCVSLIIFMVAFWTISSITGC